MRRQTSDAPQQGERGGASGAEEEALLRQADNSRNRPGKGGGEYARKPPCTAAEEALRTAAECRGRKVPRHPAA